ncbi:protein JINGUBANG [Selaginella moellendorffii]|nr:protein JINGUBANG [Selaginella moellendorffii]|eukprot:XP_002968427.2 protein JINGUBANG [Selaginella moellendorffii]
MELGLCNSAADQASSLESSTASCSSTSSFSRCSNSSSSIDFKLSIRSSYSHQSSASSLPSVSSFQRGSSVDSALLCLYTSCVFKNFPYKSLPSTAIASKSGITALCATESPELLLVGTESHGIHQNPCASKEFEAVGSRGGSIKAILEHQNRVLTAHQDGKIRVWRKKKRHRQEQGIISEEIELCHTLPTVKDVLSRSILPSSYIQVRRHRKKLWIQHADAVSCLAATKDLVFSASWDRSLKIWRAADWKCLNSVRAAHDDAINAVAAAQQFVYTAAADGKIKAWELCSNSQSSSFLGGKNKAQIGLSLVAVLERHKSSVNALALDSSSGYLYSASSDRSIVVWEREETAMHMAAVDALRGHCMAVLCLAISSGIQDGHFFLCSGSADRTIRVWSRERFTAIHSCLCVIKGHQGPVKSVSMAACSSSSIGAGARVVSGGLDRQVKTWWVSLDGSCPDQEKLENSLVLRDPGTLVLGM